MQLIGRGSMEGSCKTGTASVIIALDRIPSSRIYDKDGHLHVDQVHITRAGVSPYKGDEIPGWQELGLDANRVYKLFRDPAELEKAVASLNNKPLLFGHNPVSASNHDHARTVGTVSRPTWNFPYLDGDMAVWSGPAIDCIKDDSQKELSSAYHYTAVAEPGAYDGEPYDLRMKDISFNHVGLVPRGRVGSDCVVLDSAETVLEHLSAATEAAKQIATAQDAGGATNGRAGPHTPDGAPTRTIIMAKQALSGAAAHTQGALATYLKPKLAQDAKVDLGPLLKGITAKNFVAHKPALVLGLKSAVKGKLAQDEDVDDVGELVDDIGEAVVEAVAEASGLSEEEVAAQAAAAGENGDDDTSGAEDDDMADFRAMLKDKGLEDDMVEAICAAVAKMMPADRREDDTPPAATVVGDGKGSKPAMDSKNFVSRAEAERMARDAAANAAKGKVDQPAMDSAIRSAVEGERKRQTELRGALDYVRPWVGTMTVTCDSAEAVHRAALTTLGVEHKGVDASALKTIIGLTPKPGDTPARPTRVAQDAAQANDYATRFPNANRLHV